MRPEIKCSHLTSLRHDMCMPSISNMIYHKFSHGAASYMVNGKYVNVMLELSYIYLHEATLLMYFCFILTLLTYTCTFDAIEDI